MPLPAGFKLNGSAVAAGVGLPVPPRAKKLMAVLDQLPSGDLLSTMELCARAHLAITGHNSTHPALAAYREKVDGKLFWGSRSSIVQLRKQLAEAEESHEEN